MNVVVGVGSTNGRPKSKIVRLEVDRIELSTWL
jgi:hypothetical protein